MHHSTPRFTPFIVTALLGSCCAIQSFAQTPAPSPKAQTDQSSSTSKSEVRSNLKGSGISGPGKPVEGNGWGGYRTGNEGLSKASPSASVVKDGLLPPIKPLWELHLRDTVICLGGDGNYYMTGSSGDNIWDFNDGVDLWRSKDLQKWDYLGVVWNVRRDGTWEKEPRDLHGKPTVTIWAPEIRYLKKLNTYVIVLSMAPSGISLLKSTTGKPEGPYVNTVPGGKQLRGGIDPTVFEDDDGKVYFTNGPGGTIRLLKDDL